jgi:predicted alpha/beta hydrolase family esterase
VRVLILHGLEGSGPDHWQSWLAERLRSDGHDVAFPDLPDADAPQLEPWLDAIAAERRPNDVVVCHSLACCAWLHHRQRGGPEPERALLVAPPWRDDIPEIRPFFPVPGEPGLAGSFSLLVFSDNDPYCPDGADRVYGEPLAIDLHPLPGRGHINPEAGYGEWPWALDWVYAGEKNGSDT